MKEFDSFLVEANKAKSKKQKPRRVNNSVVMLFGRHNPPHKGHGKLFNAAHQVAKNIGGINEEMGEMMEEADQRFYTSRSQDPENNPLPFEMKMGFLKEMFPEHAGKFDDDPNVKTVLDAAKKAHGDGYKDLHFVGGEDRRQPMEDLIRRYNGDMYEFYNIYSHTAGDRSPNSEDPLAQLTSSKLRKHAMNNDFDQFKEGTDMGNNFDPKALFQALQMFMTKNESMEYDELRELYKAGMLYNVGDIVESLTTGLVGNVHRCGANHLICVTEDGVMFKNFINDVQLV